ncbi:MAG: helix-hairpin-helix domain-containing protein [Flavobacteriaceae bacterium]|nr:helix-hairpin-helix domain-containing protein [Muriicola sp.]NNL40447.1 helix-hairpin-helix domain-containing protein [Flavobacteriaceae bacterium]
MKSHFRYSKQEKRGIFFLLFLIASLQSGFYFINLRSTREKEPYFTVDTLAQAFIDSVKASPAKNDRFKLRPFNPNFITDYRGYVLGITPEELDRLYDFRKTGQYIRTAEEFQTVTQITDELFTQVEPYFKFPSFRQNNKTQSGAADVSIPRDLNSATAAELQKISGIGPVLSSRIIRFRDRLGGFMVTEQLLDVYGLDREVAEKAMKKFQVLNTPEIRKINLNKAHVNELTGLVYLNRAIARKIVAYREQLGRYDSIEQLTKIEDFPTERIQRIKLYLAL